MNQEIRSKLDSITNALFGGGVNNPITYIEQISYLIFLKLLDEEESRRELKGRLISKGGGNGQSLYPGQASRYRWSNWRFKSGNDLRDFIRDDVFPYMASLVKEEPQVAIYFQDARLEIEDPNVLKQAIDELDKIDFLKLGTDVKGDIYEYLLTYLNTMEGALLDQFRTPRQIRLAMVAMLDPDLGDTIFDPASGTGGFLIDSVEHILAKYSATPREVPIYGEDWLEKRGLTIAQAKKEIPNLQTFLKGAGEKIPDWKLLENAIYGIEVSRQMMRVSMMNLVLHGIRHANVKRANALSEMGGLTEDDLRRKYKVILSNPPFAGVLPKESVRQDLPTQSKKSELLFLGVMMEALAPGGRCAVIVPEGLLFGSTTAHVDLRRQLVHNYDLQAVISLPAGVFKPYAGVKTGILIFRKPADAAASTKRVWFYQINNDGYDPDKITGGGRPETPQENQIPDLLRQWQSYRKSGFEKPPGVEGGKILPAGTEQPTCWWVSASTISENDFNLAAGRYKPQVGEKPPEEDPAELINKTLTLEHEISTGLKTLLKEVGIVE
ncbi:Type I restriction-modification system methyltransferase subunit [Verrucomicrobia bacterium]|nr:Type I restriction-modification system methyltransferase subunit [Verrucomicrobiota bacterium]